jgi:hypothetical protein
MQARAMPKEELPKELIQLQQQTESVTFSIAVAFP